MSRFGGLDWDGPDFQNQAAFQHHNYDQALKSRRGRKALAELREALMALPEHKLIRGALCTVNPEKRFRWEPEEWDGIKPFEVREAGGEGVCLVGAFAWYKGLQKGKDPTQAFDDLPTIFYEEGDGPFETAWVGEGAGLTYQLAWRLGYMNDEEWWEMEPEARWEAALAWVDAELAKPYDPALAR